MWEQTEFPSNCGGIVGAGEGGPRLWGGPGVFPPPPTHLSVSEQERGQQKARPGMRALISDHGVHVQCCRQWGPLPALSLVPGEVTRVLYFCECVLSPGHPFPLISQLA